MDIRVGNDKPVSAESCRTISLDGERIGCASVIGYNHYLSVSKCKDFHVHPGCVELVVCLRGNCVYSTPDGEYALKAGGIMVSRPDQPHVLKEYHKALRMYWIHFRLPKRGESVLGLTQRESAWLTDRLMSFPSRVFRGSEEMRRNFSRIFSIYDKAPRRSAERSVLLKTAVMDILTTALAASMSVPNAPKQRVLTELVEQMQRQPARRYPLDDLAERCGMSVSNLLLAFRRQTGLSPHAFLLTCRIESAKRLLAEGRSVSSVSDIVGFSSQKRFSAYFRQAVGWSPREWLKERK